MSPDTSLQPETKSLIVLVGLMGSGKTAVGRELAQFLHINFSDSDELVEKRAKLSVREIFAELGEPEFRRLETEALTVACASTEPKVLAVAGGAVVAESNRNLLAQCARCIVWLDAPTSTLVARTGRAKHRPLLDSDPVGALTTMRSKRETFYRQLATHKIATQSLTIAQVVEDVVKMCDLANIVSANQ